MSSVVVIVDFCNPSRSKKNLDIGARMVTVACSRFLTQLIASVGENVEFGFSLFDSWEEKVDHELIRDCAFTSLTEPVFRSFSETLHNAVGSSSVSHSRQAKKTLSAENTRRELTYVLTDFQWGTVRLDDSSTFPFGGMHYASTSQQSFKNRFVLLFSMLPSLDEKLASSLLKSSLASHYQQLGVSLVWIDTSSLWSSTNMTFSPVHTDFKKGLCAFNSGFYCTLESLIFSPGILLFSKYQSYLSSTKRQLNNSEGVRAPMRVSMGATLCAVEIYGDPSIHVFFPSSSKFDLVIRGVMSRTQVSPLWFDSSECMVISTPAENISARTAFAALMSWCASQHAVLIVDIRKEETMDSDRKKQIDTTPASLKTSTHTAIIEPINIIMGSMRMVIADVLCTDASLGFMYSGSVVNREEGYGEVEQQSITHNFSAETLWSSFPPPPYTTSANIPQYNQLSIIFSNLASISGSFYPSMLESWSWGENEMAMEKNEKKRSLFESLVQYFLDESVDNGEEEPAEWRNTLDNAYKDYYYLREVKNRRSLVEEGKEITTKARETLDRSVLWQACAGLDIMLIAMDAVNEHRDNSQPVKNYDVTEYVLRRIFDRVKRIYVECVLSNDSDSSTDPRDMVTGVLPGVLEWLEEISTRDNPYVLRNGEDSVRIVIKNPRYTLQKFIADELLVQISRLNSRYKPINDTAKIVKDIKKRIGDKRKKGKKKEGRKGEGAVFPDHLEDPQNWVGRMEMEARELQLQVVLRFYEAILQNSFHTDQVIDPIINVQDSIRPLCERLSLGIEKKTGFFDEVLVPLYSEKFPKTLIIIYNTQNMTMPSSLQSLVTYQSSPSPVRLPKVKENTVEVNVATLGKKESISVLASGTVPKSSDVVNAAKKSTLGLALSSEKSETDSIKAKKSKKGKVEWKNDIPPGRLNHFTRGLVNVKDFLHDVPVKRDKKPRAETVSQTTQARKRKGKPEEEREEEEDSRPVRRRLFGGNGGSRSMDSSDAPFAALMRPPRRRGTVLVKETPLKVRRGKN